MNKYYALTQNEDVADLVIFGDITSWPWLESDVSAYGLTNELAQIKASQINVMINSMGGEVAESLAIYNALKNHAANVTTYCEGFACSGASVIFMAGNERIMEDASMLMIHNPWTHICGNADELRKNADDLDKIAQASKAAYLSGIAIDESELNELLEDETWLSPQDALSMGFCTGIGESNQNEAVNQSAFGVIKAAIVGEGSHIIDAGIIETESKIDEKLDGISQRLVKLSRRLDELSSTAQEVASRLIALESANESTTIGNARITPPTISKDVLLVNEPDVETAALQHESRLKQLMSAFGASKED